MHEVWAGVELKVKHAGGWRLPSHSGREERGPRGVGSGGCQLGYGAVLFPVPDKLIIDKKNDDESRHEGC